MKITITANNPDATESEHTKNDPVQSKAAAPNVSSISLDPVNLFTVGWNVFKTAWKIVLTLGVVLMLVSMAGQITLEALADNWVAVPLNFAYSALQLFISAGMIYALLRVMRGQQAEIKDLFSQTSVFVQFLLANIAYALLIMLGLLLLVIPGIYWALKYALVPYLVVDKQMSVGAAFAESSKLTNGKLWQLFIFTLMAAVLNIAGFFALGVGLLITIPVTTLAQVELYRRLSGESTATPDELDALLNS